MKISLKELPGSTVLLNRGCGINYLQRRAKIPFGSVPENTWFLKEKLSDKIAIDISWSQLEPHEGEFLWDQPEWEGCFRSWMDAGFKILLKVRGMDTLGTFYNQGTPQWVFDAGAHYVDEPIDFYRNSWLLNEIPENKRMPIRYPVYWDDVYLEKAANLIRALGKRYNGNPAIESFAIAHTGRWGEMHIADHYPRTQWEKEGYSIPKFLEGHRKLIDLYREAFPDTKLQQSVCEPSFQDSFLDAEPSFAYLAEHGIMLKSGGLGKSWHPPFASPYLDDNGVNMLRKYRYQSKIVFENLVLPEALEFALSLGMSYWQRGGEASGLGELNIERPIPIVEKKIYSMYKFYPEQYNRLNVEQEKEIWRHLARRTGFRLSAESVDLETGAEELLSTKFVWKNTGCAPCYEQFKVRLEVCDSNGKKLFSEAKTPSCGLGPRVWDAGKTIVDTMEWKVRVPNGARIFFGLEQCAFAGERMVLGNEGRSQEGLYEIR